MRRLLGAFLTLGWITLSAAVIDGTWTGQMTGRNGTPRDMSFTFKADGEKLTGTMLGPMGREMEIREGKIAGDEISFVIFLQFGDAPVKMSYSGKLSGDELKMKVQREGAPRSTEFALKKAAGRKSADRSLL